MILFSKTSKGVSILASLTDAPHLKESNLYGKPLSASHRRHCNMCNTRSTFETSRCNICNIRLKHRWNTSNMCQKHLKKNLKTLEKLLQKICSIQKNTCNICVKHMQHPDKHTCNIRLKNRRNIWNKCLQHTWIVIPTHAISRSTFTISIWNTYNLLIKQLKYLKHTLATCAFSNPC
jgi:hypothetical protein